MPIPKETGKQYFTYTEYKLWSDDEKWGIINGEAYNRGKDA